MPPPHPPQPSWDELNMDVLVNTYFSSFKFLLSSYDCILFYIKSLIFLLRENVILCCDEFFYARNIIFLAVSTLKLSEKWNPAVSAQSRMQQTARLWQLWGLNPCFSDGSLIVPDFTLSVCTAVHANFSVSISFYLIWFDKKTTVLYTVFLMGQFHETYIIRRAKLRTAKF